ncbi:MAG: ATPase [Methylococcaceae bacterium]|nr:ATPase [Methylococcaceae bacterium]
MSIVKLSKVTFIGLAADRESLLTDLQKMGCLQIIPLATESMATTEAKSTVGAREALQFLKTYPYRRRQETNEQRFDPLAIEQKVLTVRDTLHKLEDERDFLIKRLQDMQPWGDFVLPSLAEMGNYRLWFYVVAHHDLPKITEFTATWEIVRSDQRFCYVVVVSEDEPTDITVPRVHLGDKPREQLAARLDDVYLAIEDTEAERAALTRWYELFSRNITRLEDRAACLKAASQAYNQELAFAIQGWAATEVVSTLNDYAENHSLYFDAQDATLEDHPPTFMRNHSWLAAGEDLVTFYMTPGYQTWDPSSVTFVSFVIFFAMILADAGYAAVLSLGLFMGWKKLGRSASGLRMRPLLLSIASASVLFGILMGSYFGVTPSSDSWLGKLHIIDMTNTNRMMALSVAIGVFHIVLANVMNASCYPHWQQRLPSIGWISIIIGASALALSLVTVGTVLMVIGALLILVFSAPNEKPLARCLQGLLGLTRLSGAMGDILSYLRLFALGLGSASLSIEFNRMAVGVYEGSPVGLVLAILILLLGHSVNLILGVASGVIHGLRLNVIEFFNWGLAEEGTLYKPFKQIGD